MCNHYTLLAVMLASAFAAVMLAATFLLLVLFFLVLATHMLFSHFSLPQKLSRMMPSLISWTLFRLGPRLLHHARFLADLDLDLPGFSPRAFAVA